MWMCKCVNVLAVFSVENTQSHNFWCWCWLSFTDEYWTSVAFTDKYLPSVSFTDQYLPSVGFTVAILSGTRDQSSSSCDLERGGGGADREQQATEYCIMFTLDTVYLERMPDWRWLMGKTWMAPRGFGCGVDRPWNHRWDDVQWLI